MLLHCIVISQASAKLSKVYMRGGISPILRAPCAFMKVTNVVNSNVLFARECRRLCDAERRILGEISLRKFYPRVRETLYDYVRYEQQEPKVLW